MKTSYSNCSACGYVVNFERNNSRLFQDSDPRLQIDSLSDFSKHIVNRDEFHCRNGWDSHLFEKSLYLFLISIRRTLKAFRLCFTEDRG